MLFSLAEIINKSIEKYCKEVTFEISEVTCNSSVYKVVEKSPISLTFIKHEKKMFLIKAEIDLVLCGSCDRCLSDANVPLHISVAKEVDFTQTEEERTEDLDETCFIDGYDLDVDRLIYEEILIGFPSKVLCKDDCKGICKVCGANRNEMACDCDGTELDPRMSVIRDLFESFQKNN